MKREKRRPTLEELRCLPLELWQLEVAQIGVDANLAEQTEIENEAIRLMDDPNLTPETVVELREKFRRATGSTEQKEVA